MSNEETLYDSWSDYPHAMTARASWTDKTDPEELKKYTCREFPTPEPPKVKQRKKHVRRLKKAVVHSDFNLGKRKRILPEREFCIAPSCDGECEKCNRVTVAELERVRENGLPCPFTGEVCRRSIKVICEFNCNRYLKIQREWIKYYSFLEKLQKELEEDESEVKK